MDPRVFDLAFPLRGSIIPADHGYALYGSIARIWPEIHGNKEIGVHRIRGRLVGGRRLQLLPESRLTLRLPETLVANAVDLTGKELNLDGLSVVISGPPSFRPLRPSVTLQSYLVTIAGYLDEHTFLDAVRHQLSALAIEGIPSLIPRQMSQSVEGQTSRDPSSYIRRTVRIRDKDVVGFAVRVHQLTAEESVRLQTVGIGGRRRFGCGIFVPVLE